MENKKMTALNVSVGADTEQSPNVCTDSITDLEQDFKEIEEMQREMFRQMQPSYLKTVSMADLYETDFEAQSALIDNLLYQGTYLFVGSPKVGKSFMMAQLAYHISTGTPLWNYKVKQATVLYFALEDDYPRLQRRLFKMFGADGTENLYFATQCKTLDGGLDEQIRGFIREHPDTGLIIIDTLKRVREVGVADYSYASDYDVVAKLKALADSCNIAMLIVHHVCGNGLRYRRHLGDFPRLGRGAKRLRKKGLLVLHVDLCCCRGADVCTVPDFHGSDSCSDRSKRGNLELCENLSDDCKLLRSVCPDCQLLLQCHPCRGTVRQGNDGAAFGKSLECYS